MAIKIGNLDISSFKVGGNDCSIYLGDIKLYPNESPSFDGKWLATYTGGTTSSAECDSSSAITQNEITKTDLESVVIGDCVTSIGNYVFDECIYLTSVTIGSGVTSIGNYVFDECIYLTSVTIGSGVTSIGDGAFSYCHSLTSITIPNSVTTIGNYAFDYCRSLTSVTIPSSVTSIGNNAFQLCQSLTSLTIGTSITTIGNYAFNDCESLSSLTVNATTPPTLSNANAFANTPIASGTGYIYVPSASVEAYKAATNWSTYASRIQAIPNS